MSGPAVSAPTGGLELEDVTLRQRNTLVLRGLSWEVRPGRIAWVVGENGAGKSTLLRCLAGRLPASGGRVRRPPGRVAYLHPAVRPPPGARVSDWMRLLEGLGSAEWEPSELAPPGLRGEQRIDRLSTGETRRLLLDALLRRPAQLYLLDEPFDHLSPASRTRLAAILDRRARHAVVVVATHHAPAESGSGSLLRLLGEALWETGEGRPGCR